MTATILAFPSQLERDDAEFRRTGRSSYIRAIDEAEMLWAAAQARPTEPALASRITAFARQMELLEAQRPGVAENMIELGGLTIELRMVPDLLSPLTAQRPI